MPESQNSQCGSMLTQMQQQNTTSSQTILTKGHIGRFCRVHKHDQQTWIVQSFAAGKPLV